MSFSGQSKALILLINDSGMQLLSWHKGSLTWLDSYRSTLEDQESFATSLDAWQGFPVIIVTDLLEESFRHDVIVHVGGGDRAALLKRKVDFAFRNTPYKLAKVTGRLEHGRRDDRVLMSAITKPDLLELWVSTLLSRRFAIQSITSVAWLLHSFVALNKLDQEEHLLIINLDEHNNLRQTFIKKGRVLFSRLTTLTTRDVHQLGSDIHIETQQIRQYLERIQFVPYEHPLRIQVYAPVAESLLQLEARSTDINRFEVFNVRPLLDALPVQLVDQAPSSVHYFLLKVLERQKPENIYGPVTSRKYQDLNNLARMLSLCAGAILLLGLGISLPLALDVLDKWDQRDAMIAQTGPLRAEYDSLSARFPETPIPSREMELIVQTHDIIRSQIASPFDSINLVARALALSPGLELTALNWALAPKAPDPAQAPVDAFGNVGRNASSPDIDSIDGFAALVLQQQTRLTMEIEGEAYSPGSYRDAQNQVIALVEALAANAGVAVSASRMPTDVRTDISVSTTVDDREVRAPFTVDLSMEQAP